MATVSLGDLAHTFMLRRQTTTLKAEAQRLSSEMTSGLAADIGKKIVGDYSALGGIDASLTRLQGFKSVTAEIGVLATGVQTVLGTVNDTATGLGPMLLQAGSGESSTGVDPVGVEALWNFESAVSAFNTEAGGRSLFSGVETGKPALADADVILQALETASAGASSAADVERTVSDWFDDPSGYAATAYLGGGSLSDISVGPHDSVTLGVTAADPAIRETLKGMAMAALLGRGIFDGDATARADLATRAGNRLIRSEQSLVQLAATVGLVEERIDAAAARNSAEMTALQVVRTELAGVDSYETASMMEATQTQLETVYALTERISRLSLLDYL